MQVTAIVLHSPFADVPNGHSAGELGSIKNLAQPGPFLFNQLIEFTAVKPNAPALRAIVNLDPLANAHQEVRVRANRAFNTDPILSVWAIDTMLQASRGGLVESLGLW